MLATPEILRKSSFEIQGRGLILRWLRRIERKYCKASHEKQHNIAHTLDLSIEKKQIAAEQPRSFMPLLASTVCHQLNAVARRGVAGILELRGESRFLLHGYGLFHSLT